MINLGSKTIETDNLILKAQTMDEQYYLWQTLMIPEVRKYCVADPKEKADIISNWQTFEPYVKDKIIDANNLNVFSWSIFLKETNECIGEISSISLYETGVSGYSESVRNVGWFLNPKYMRKGYGYEAAKAMIDYLFLECEIEEIVTYAAIENPASWKLMEKLGFTKLHFTIKAQYTYIDEPVYAYQYILSRTKYLENRNNKVR